MTADLAASVEAFDRRLRPIGDEDLGRDWAWGVYDEEGIRFAFLRTIEEVADLAVEVAARRAASGRPLGRAQAIVGRYHVAYRELWSVVDAAEPERIDQPPGPDDWPVRQTLEHLIGADLGFYVVQANAIERRRQGLEPGRPGEAAWWRIAGTTEPEYDAVFAASVDEIRSFHGRIHDHIVDELAGLSDGDLAAGSLFWDGEMPNRFRLGRFESHLRQHTIQIEKTLATLSGPPREVDRLLRLLRRAQGDLEAASLGATDLLAAERSGLAAGIDARADELVAVAAGR